jgi:hypothetical protein
MSSAALLSYIAKAFATLEGIGLAADPSYSILNETLPYVSRRILTDPSERVAGALESFIFGDAKHDGATRVLDAERVTTLLDGVRRYAAAAALQSDGGGAGLGAARATLADPAALGVAADEVIDLLAQDTPTSRLVLEQLTLLVSASSRRSWEELRARSGTLSPPAFGSLGRVGTRSEDAADPPPRSLLGALVDPLGLLRRSALVNTDGRDEAALEAARKLSRLVSDLLEEEEGAELASLRAALSEPTVQRQLAQTLVTKAWERRDALQAVSRRVAAEALDQAASRLATSRGAV